MSTKYQESLVNNLSVDFIIAVTSSMSKSNMYIIEDGIIKVMVNNDDEVKTAK